MARVFAPLPITFLLQPPSSLLCGMSTGTAGLWMEMPVYEMDRTKVETHRSFDEAAGISIVLSSHQRLNLR